MGYCSTHMFSTTLSGYYKLLEFLKEENKGVKYPVEKPWEYEELHNGVIFGFSFVKWYGSEFDAFERAWERWTKEGYPWTRIRIGEDLDDVEEQYSKIAWDVDFPKLFVQRSWDYE